MSMPSKAYTYIQCLTNEMKWEIHVNYAPHENYLIPCMRRFRRQWNVEFTTISRDRVHVYEKTINILLHSQSASSKLEQKRIYLER